MIQKRSAHSQKNQPPMLPEIIRETRPDTGPDTGPATAADRESECPLTLSFSPPLFHRKGTPARHGKTRGRYEGSCEGPARNLRRRRTFGRDAGAELRLPCTGSEPAVHSCVMVPNARQLLYGQGVKLSDFMVGLVGQTTVKGIRSPLWNFCGPACRGSCGRDSVFSDARHALGGCRPGLFSGRGW